MLSSSGLNIGSILVGELWSPLSSEKLVLNIFSLPAYNKHPASFDICPFPPFPSHLFFSSDLTRVGGIFFLPLFVTRHI